MSRKIYFFNMVEILLALTVIAIGMTSVLGLFPVGLNASREAIAQSCSADVADQMVTYMRVMGESSADSYNKTFSFTSPYDLTCLPTFDTSGADNLDIQTFGDSIKIDLKGATEKDVDVQTLSDNFLAAYKSGKIVFGSTDTSSFPRVAPGWAIFTKYTNVSNLRRRVYFIVQGPNCTEDDAINRNIDYSAMALVWKEPVQIRRYNGTAWKLWPSVPLDSDNPLDPKLSASYDYSAKINIELSWPLELPYKDRKKRYYQIVINKPN